MTCSDILFIDDSFNNGQNSPINNYINESNSICLLYNLCCNKNRFNQMYDGKYRYINVPYLEQWLIINETFLGPE